MLLEEELVFLAALERFAFLVDGLIGQTEVVADDLRPGGDQDGCSNRLFAQVMVNNKTDQTRTWQWMAVFGGSQLSNTFF